MKPLSSLACSLFTFACLAVPPGRAADGAPDGLWSHPNLAAWCTVPFDAKGRRPEERAQMLERLGFTQFAYDWRDKEIPTFDAEIDALQRHRIQLLAWWFPLEATDPLAKTTLEIFQRHQVHPQLWVSYFPEALKNAGAANAEGKKPSPEERQKRVEQIWAEDVRKTPAEQEERVQRESDRIYALVKLATPYGCRVELYNHNGWFGMEKNQLAIIARLKQRGVSSVGMVYNFSHSHDEQHDDSDDFPAIWKSIQAHVVAMNVTGVTSHGSGLIYPSQGTHDLEMMRVIQDSGWTGPVGLIAEKGGDAEVTLKNYLIGLDWLAAELRSPGAGGPPPFSPAL